MFQFTLPRGERQTQKQDRQWTERFNSRSRGGSDRRKKRMFDDVEFQFTLPRGERRACEVRASRLRRFQFTLPRGERQDVVSPHILIK